MRKKLVLGASVGECVHVAGLLNFLGLAEEHGYETCFLGPAVPVQKLVDQILSLDPAIVAVSYRLTPEAGAGVFEELASLVRSRGLDDRLFAFGGTEPVCQVARRTGLFDVTFSMRTPINRVVAFLRGEVEDLHQIRPPDLLVERIRWKAPYPLIRHHFGRPSLEETVSGIEKIAEAGVLDIVSIGPDQNAQQFFFHPELMDHTEDGAGGVPVRSPEDFRALHAASRRGNYPLMRCYSGTQDVLKLAEVLLNTINNAWVAVPLCWYNVLDGRGNRDVVTSITEALAMVSWHAARGVPVEMNEAHHWSLRDAHDTIAVATAFLAAYNAKKAGTRHYVSQLMFNTPPKTSFVMDLAKMLAYIELIEGLHDENFQSYRQTRAGLSSFPADEGLAKGQLASSTMLQMAVKPHIVHVVSFSEADHAATPDDVIESCRIVDQVIHNCLEEGLPDMTLDPRVQARKTELLDEAAVLLSAIQELAEDGVEDPWSDPGTLARAIKVGVLDAPHLRGNPNAAGRLMTRIIDGACHAIHPATREKMSEDERLKLLLPERLQQRPPDHAAGTFLHSRPSS